MFRRHFEAARRMMTDDRIEVIAAVEQVVADTAADKSLLDPLDRPHFGIEIEQRTMVVIEVGAHLRMQARRTAAFAAQLPVAAAHAVHVGRRRSDVRKVTPEIGHAGHPLYFAKDGFFAARSDELALVGRYGAEGAAAETTPMDIDRVLDHLPGRNVATTPVAGVRRPLVRQIERMIQLLGRKRRVGRRDDRIAVADTFDERFVRFHQVAQGFDAGEVLPKGPLVGHALLVGVQADRSGGIEPLHIAAVGHESHLSDISQQLGVESVVHRPRHLLNHPLAHAVDQKVGPAVGEDRGMERIAPVVVVGQAAQ